MQLAIRDPLVFPAGRAPGFDPTHPLAAGALFSAIPAGNDFVSLTNGKAGTIAGAPVASINGFIGPAVSFTASSQKVSFSGQPTTNFSSFTIAGFFVSNSPGSGYQTIFQNSTTHTGYCVQFNSGSAALAFTVQNKNTYSGPTLSANIPYFFIVSAQLGGSVNFVVVNLNTGAVLTKTVSGVSSTAVAPNGTYYVGTDWAADYLNGLAGPVMCSNAFFSPSQLLAIVADPWPFWYPQDFLEALLVGSTSAAYSLAAAQGSYALTGEAQALNAARSLLAAQGAYALTGQVQALNAARTMFALEGVYALTGESVTLVYNAATGGLIPHHLPFLATPGRMTAR